MKLTLYQKLSIKTYLQDIIMDIKLIIEILLKTWNCKK